MAGIFKVKFMMGNGIKEVLGGEEGRVEGVLLNSGETLPANLVLVGLGVTPSTEFVKVIPDRAGHLQLFAFKSRLSLWMSSFIY